MSTHGASSHIHFERNCLVVGLYSKGVVFSFLEIGVKGKHFSSLCLLFFFTRGDDPPELCHLSALHDALRRKQNRTKAAAQLCFCNLSPAEQL